ncbi:MAG TPA: purine-nucleoside phosphorylase [Bacteroidia bacterium]|nr:purine-nucleoside phosphorylase [Sphingobacteriales bacterium]HPD64952.1 purine-nucleoside phosphorylase [Bacteroidia bacterium]HRS58174.1 purine-nucleoside phosphorylase [Bacteroidia bacterium]HRU67504.1 purine-nucleoside phosphorylase [Bacteroidia bacterium]
MLEKIKETVSFIRQQADFQPEYGIILGTGLGGLIKEIDIIKSIDYRTLPHFPVSTVESHAGKLVFGYLEKKRVVVMQGRFHYYEGYSFQEITFPVRVLKLLGIKALIVSNACGSVNPEMKTGELMIIKDHINLLGGNPLRGKNIDELGPRFPDMSEPYKKEFIDLALSISGKLPIKVHCGVYASVQGPNLETPAEYRFLRIIGADVVGMSTVPEVIVARHARLPVFAVSVITDEGFHEENPAVTLQDVLQAAGNAEPYMTQLIKEFISQLS